MPVVPAWAPPVPLSPAEERVLRRCKKQPIFAFLRAIRHELFDEAFQRELAAMYGAGRRGRPPVAPALLAMASLLQSARGLSDQDAALAAVTDRAWQVVLGTLGEDAGDEDGPFSQTALFEFRLRLIAHEMDRRLVERTLELGQKTGLFSPRALRAAFDASPLRGSGRVEDTINLLGHAARELVRTAAKALGTSFDEAAREAGIPLLCGTSVKAALDVDWSDVREARSALDTLLAQVQALAHFLDARLGPACAEPPLREQLQTLTQVLGQDLEPDPEGGGRQRIRRAVAKERRISIRDGQMRHGRKSRAVRFDGYKRHVARVGGEGSVPLVAAVALTPANRPEGEAAGELFADLERQGLLVAVLDVDRAYLHAPPVQWRCGLGLEVRCRAPRTANGPFYGKDAFDLDPERGRVRCPAGQERPLVPGRTVHFDARTCNACSHKTACTPSAHGRSLTLHRNERQLVALRRAQRTAAGRAELRRRVAVEHALARVGQIQGPRGRYWGQRRNLFDLRRAAVLANLFALRDAGYQAAA